MIETVIRKARAAGVKIGLCGQAPSDYPAFAQFLVECGIGSISFNPDALLHGIENINAAEAKHSHDDVTNNDELPPMSRDNTYVKPAPVTNQEWEDEDNESVFLK